MDTFFSHIITNDNNITTINNNNNNNNNITNTTTIIDFIQYFKLSLSYNNNNNNNYIFEMRKLLLAFKNINVDDCFIDFTSTQVKLLWMAVIKKRLDLVEFLIQECKVNLDFCNNNNNNNNNPLKGSTAVFAAVYLKYYNIAKYLIDKGANVNISNAFDVTPLMQSVDNVKLCQYLIENGKANVNKKDGKGVTVLEYAINNYHFETVILLLRNKIIISSDNLLIEIAHRLNYCDNISDKMKMNILQKFIKTSDDYYTFNKSTIADAYELLSVSFYNIHHKIYYLHKAIYIRNLENIKKNIIPLYNDNTLCHNYCKTYYHHYFLNIIGNNYVEFTCDLNDYMTTPIKRKIQEIFICERVIPYYSHLFITQILDLSELLFLLFGKEEKKSSFNLLIYALQFKDIGIMDITECFFTLFFNNNDDDNKYYYGFLIELLIKFINKEFNYIKNKCYNQLLFYTLDLLYLCIINDGDNNNNIKLIKCLLQDHFYSLKARNESFDSLLHIIVSDNYEKHNFFFRNEKIITTTTTIDEIQYVLLKYLILDCNIDINCLNSYNCTPLFILLKKFKENEDKYLYLIQLLIVELGANIDQMVSVKLNCLVHKDFDISCYDFVMYNYTSQCCCNDNDDSFSNELRQIFEDRLL